MMQDWLEILSSTGQCIMWFRVYSFSGNRTGEMPPAKIVARIGYKASTHERMRLTEESWEYDGQYMVYKGDQPAEIANAVSEYLWENSENRLNLSKYTWKV
ncbi:hypothetical protein PP175_12400 [Aneurinibacillus sp. Ricciae_BoGa-3]|uniref:hypothetical protein n=1 Tax=Aneurinibacillus sp. Ricciae_BoGa-3 TaxID=3022697 RepID=UPI0023413048|nr:hypothetical protein [Aneurinibacillus sp. Ricciae_BoGa-3]WCK56639.1 hypothetical protein PP175_12400 [Aneurinibacillus sp. Ricciae_BoGa-3]